MAITNQIAWITKIIECVYTKSYYKTNLIIFSFYLIPLHILITYLLSDICSTGVLSQQDNTDTALPVALWVLVDIVQTPTYRDNGLRNVESKITLRDFLNSLNLLISEQTKLLNY